MSGPDWERRECARSHNSATRRRLCDDRQNWAEHFLGPHIIRRHCVSSRPHALLGGSITSIEEYKLDPNIKSVSRGVDQIGCTQVH